jgi:aminomethyltransferase
MPQRTPLYDWHLAHGGRMVDFAGWELPVSYGQGIIAEHLACRAAATLFEVSHMGRFLVRGSGALAFLRAALTNDAALLAPGTSQYTLLSDEAGRPLDDAYLFQLAPEEYLLVVNAAKRQDDWQHLQGFLEAGAELIDWSEATAMLALQGPASQAALAGVMEGPLPPHGRGRCAWATWRSEPMLVTRSGYTGEPLSFELVAPAELAADLADALLAAGAGAGLMPAGLGARDTLRLEACLPLYGHELGPDRPMLSLPLARGAVFLGQERGDFAGRTALEAQAAELAADPGGAAPRQVPKSIYALAALERAMMREGAPVLAGGREVGTLTSGTTVPAWRFAGESPGTEHYTRALGLAYLERGLAVGQEVEVLYRNKPVRAMIVRRFMRRAGDYLRAVEY